MSALTRLVMPVLAVVILTGSAAEAQASWSPARLVSAIISSRL